MKRLISILLVLTMLVPAAVVSAEDGTLKASATFGENGAAVSGMTVTTETGKEFVAETVSGNAYWKLAEGDNMADDQTVDANRNIDMTFEEAGSSSYGNYRLEVTYLDKGHGHFVVYYNSYNGKKKVVTKLENSGNVKTASIPIMRTDLSNFIDQNAGGTYAISIRSYDLWGYEYSYDPVYIAAAKVYALGTEDKADITFKTTGIDTNFTDGDTVSLKYTIQSNMETSTAWSLSYTVLDENNAVLWSGTDSVTTGANGVKPKTVTPKVGKYGVHKLVVEARNEASNLYSRAEQEFAVYKKNANKKSGFSVSSHFCYQDDYIKTMPMLENMGTSFIRDELWWKTYEKEKGVYTLPDGWNAYINEAVKRGIEPLIILGFGNSLYTETDNAMPTTDTELEAFGNYVYHLVSDLKGKVKYFEVWNEPNLRGVETGVEYAKLLKVAYTKVKAANENAVVVGTAMAGVSDAFMDYMLREDANIFNYMDIVSFHEYCKGKAPENSNYVNTSTWCKNTLKNYCNNGTDIWLTEYGLSEHEIGITEKEAAQYSVRSVLWNDAEKYYANMFDYTWINGSGNEGYREANFGHINQDYSAKKGYIAYTAMSYFLGDKEYKERNIDSNANHVFTYSKSHETVSVAFNAEDKNGEVTLTPAYGTYTLYDMYGNELSSGNAESVTVETSGAPVYLVSNENGAMMDYSKNHVNLIGEIAGAKEGEQAMIYVLNPGKGTSDIFTADSLSYIDQITLGEGGTFEYSFPMNGGAGIYKIYIGYSGNAGLSDPITFEVKRDVSAAVGLYVGDVKIESVSDFEADDLTTLTAKGIINNKYNADVTAGLYAAGYYAGQLLWTELLNQKATYSEADIISFDIGIKSFEGVDEVKVFLWADNGAPLCGADTIN